MIGSAKPYTAVHSNALAPLLELTGNHRQAIFLDKIIYWFRISTYNLPRSTDKRIWFTRTYEQMSKETAIPVSTLKRYMQKFTESGWIDRVQKKWGYHVKAYFTIKPVLENLIKGEKNLAQTDTIDKTKTIFPIYKENKNKIINTPIGDLTSLETKVQEVLERCKNVISNPKQIKKEILFSLNNKNYFPTAKTLTHRLNIISKLLQSRIWQTPKGFTKYGKIDSKINETKKKQVIETNHGINTKQSMQNIRCLSEINGKLAALNFSKGDSNLKSRLIIEKNALIKKINHQVE